MSTEKAHLPTMPRGRPPKDPKALAAWEAQRAAAWAARGKMLPPADATAVAPSYSGKGKPTLYVVPPNPSKKSKSDEEILKAIKERFKLMHSYAGNIAKGNMRVMIVSGAAGTGKTYTIQKVLEHHKEQGTINFKSHSGTITPVHLYMMLYKHRAPNDVLLLDDCDAVLFNDVGVNILKAALDTSAVRMLSYASQSPALSQTNTPHEFQYEGSVIFITNFDFQGMVDAGTMKIVPHMKALMTRSIYLDLSLHSTRDVMLWIEYMVKTFGIGVTEGMTTEQQTEALAWMKKHQDHLREPSLRTIHKIAAIMKMDPMKWTDHAKLTELKETE